MQTLLAICAGVCLAAACGFRVFVPLLAAALATHFGYLHPSANMAWLGSTHAIIILLAATIVEIAAYYVPWIDNLLDTIASPAAVAAGTVAAAAAFGDIDPALKWTTALIAGGGSAAAIQGTTVLARAASTATTGGFANHIVSTAEAVGAITLAVLALVLPIVALLVTILLMLLLIRIIHRLRTRTRPTPAI